VRGLGFDKLEQLAVQLLPTQFLHMAQTLHSSLHLISIEKSSMQRILKFMLSLWNIG